MKTSLIFLLLLVIFAWFFGCSSGDDRILTRWNTYNGQISSDNVLYDVEIEDCSYNNSSSISRMIHLHPVGYPRYVSISGHDYDGDGTWEKIFYCCWDGKKENGTGCNSASFGSKGYHDWTFEPCSGDEGHVDRFTDNQIALAILKLNFGMAQVHKENFLTMTLEKWKKKYE